MCWVPWGSLEAPWVLGTSGSRACAVATTWIFQVASGFSCVVPWGSLEAPWVLGSSGSRACAVATTWIFPGRQRVQLCVLGPLGLPGGSLGSGLLGLPGVRCRHRVDFPGRQRVQLYVLGPLGLPGGSLGSGFLGLSGVRRRLLSKVSDHFYKLLGGGYMYKGSLL